MTAVLLVVALSVLWWSRRRWDWRVTAHGRFRRLLGSDGWATWRELRRHLPGGPRTSRLGTSAVGAPVPMPVHTRHEDVVGVVGGPRKGKSLTLAAMVRRHFGPAVVSSTRLDLHRTTVGVRALRGPVRVFCPEGTSGLVSSVWPLLDWCDDESGASAIAASMVGATDSGSAEDQTWLASATSVLSGFLLAAAISGRSMADVYDWVTVWRNPEPVKLLWRAGHEVRAQELASEVQSPSEKTAASVMRAVRLATQFMSDPAAARSVSPEPGDEVIDVEALIRSGGTLYMVNTERLFCPTGPLTAALWTHIFDIGRQLSADRPLDPSLLLAADEVKVTARVPLDDWTSIAGGHGMHVVWSAQSLAQLRDRWGEHACDAIVNNTNALVVFGGLKNEPDLRALSSLCGERREVVPDDEGGGTEWRPVLPVPLLSRLPKFRALLLSEAPPTILRTARWEKTKAAVTTAAVRGARVAQRAVTPRQIEVRAAPALPVGRPQAPPALPPVSETPVLTVVGDGKEVA